MSSGTNFALTSPVAAPSFTPGPVSGSASVTLPEIGVGPDPGMGGSDLPGDGSYGDPIAGFHQINQQMADSQRAFSERMDAQSAQGNAQLQAQGNARAAQMQAQFESNMASINAQRAALYAAPPVTGPILPPNFVQTAEASPAPLPADPVPGATEAFPPPQPPFDARTFAVSSGIGASAPPDADVPIDELPRTDPADAEQPQASSPDFSAPASGDELAFRGILLPLGRTANGDLVPAWPGFLVEISNAIAYPGRVLNGEAQVIDPATSRLTDEAIVNGWTAAGLVAGSTSGFVTREAVEAVFGSGPVRVLRGAGPQGLNVTEGVAVTGARAIDLGQAYEVGVRSLYGNNAFRAREFDTLVDGAFVSGVADNVAVIGGKGTAVEAKFVDEWANSLRNPASPNGGRPWAVTEQRAMIDQARRYSAAFAGGAVYHTNSPELAAFYGQAFRDAGIENIRFVLTPALRPGVL